MVGRIAGDDTPRTTAAYDTRCPYCDTRIYEGEDIVKIDDEWVHARHEKEDL